MIIIKRKILMVVCFFCLMAVCGADSTGRITQNQKQGKTERSIMIYQNAQISKQKQACVQNLNAFTGNYYSGSGDTDFIELLDISRRMFDPDPVYQNITMLYTPQWNGFVEGPTWNSWWIQNSYGTTYSALPFYIEPYTTFLQNSQDNWFKVQGDGKTQYTRRDNKWTPPDGHLVDHASPEQWIHKQGDGNVSIHDWPIEFTAAGYLMQAELLLISRDKVAIEKYIGNLERAADFVETRHDPNNNLYLGGPASNLLAPSYAGYKKPDGSFDKAYLAGISITQIAALDRLIEVEKLAGRPEKAEYYSEKRALAGKGLSQLLTADGYFYKSLDPDGTKHGVFGAGRHGYFEAAPNHDAVCFRVVDDAAAGRIYDKMLSIPQLRPHDLIICNYPSYDDMYVESCTGLWEFGKWINGGHWSTCEARFLLGLMRLGKYDDARRSMKAILKFADQFKMDNPLSGQGAVVYQPKKPINCTYDAFGIPAALIRGLFEYIYTADTLVLYPHIPTGITRLDQKFPVRFGTKRIYISTIGNGPVTAVSLNDKDWKLFDANSVTLPYSEIPHRAFIRIAFGGASLEQIPAVCPEISNTLPDANDSFWKFNWVSIALADADYTESNLAETFAGIKVAYDKLITAGRGDSYEAAHARTTLEAIAAIYQRQNIKAAGKLKPLATTEAQIAAQRLYIDTAAKLAEGLNKILAKDANSPDPEKRK